MTRTEVINKWNKKHHAALFYLLALTDNSEKVVYIPIENFRQLVTTQILRDLGYKHLGKFTQYGFYNDKYVYHKYEKEESSSPTH